MANVKHVGKTTAGQRVVVLFRTVPNEKDSCLVTETATLPRDYHDRLMELVESEEGQQSGELADLLNRRFFSDGTNVLNSLHSKGFIRKLNTKNVILTPNTATNVLLSEINALIEKQDPANRKPMANELASTAEVNASLESISAEALVSEPTVVTNSNTNLLLMQAEFHEKEAARLRQLVAQSQTTTDVKEQKKRGRPPKTASVG